MFGFYVFLILTGDGALRLLFHVKDTVSPENAAGPYEPRAYLPAYEGAEFDPVAMWSEIKLGTAQWLSYQPYTVWTRKPIQGQYVNVDEQGCRVTEFNSNDPEALRIWMVGGSTTWGMGVPDTETVPSRLAKLFNDSGVPTRILTMCVRKPSPSKSKRAFPPRSRYSATFSSRTRSSTSHRELVNPDQSRRPGRRARAS